MVARLQQCITLSLLALAAAWCVAWWPEHPGWAVAGALALCLGHAAVLGWECVAMLRLNRADGRVPAPTPVQVLRAWWREVFAAMRVFCWRQPFRSHAMPDLVPSPPDGSAVSHAGAAPPLRGVVLVHGLLCNRGFWTPWLQVLQARRQPCIAVTLEPIFAPIDAYVPGLDAAVRRMTEATGRAPYIVCHSMGGLVARAWLRQVDDDTRAHRIVTMGSPHHGTWLARGSRSANGRQMQLGSEWLRALSATETPERMKRFECFHSNCDNVVFPAAVATLPGAANRLVTGLPHVAMAFDAQVMGPVLARLASPD